MLHLRRAARIAAPLIAMSGVLALAACAGAPERDRAGEFSDRPEKTLYAALRVADASDEQKKQILGIYDTHHPKLKSLDEETRALIDSWHALDPHAADFPQASAEIGAKFGTLVSERVQETSALESEVAAVLDKGQWQAWIDRWNQSDIDPREGGGRRGGGGGEGGGRGRR